MAKKKACIIGGGMNTWGLREASLVDMSQEAAKACLEDLPGFSHKAIDGFLHASSFPGRCSFQTNTAPVIAERLGLQPTSICARVDVLCAGGSTGILLAKGLVESGMADIVMVAGEKLYTPQKWEIFYSNLASIDHDWDAPHGLGLPPPFFSLVAKEHMKRYGTTEEQLAKISVVNYNFGSDNPKAQFQKKLTMEEALNAPYVVAPLRLYDCCPITDGAAAVIVTSEERAKDITDRPLVYIRGGAQATLHSVSANWPGEHLADWVQLRVAAERAYEKAGVRPEDIDVAETHDCFTISEIVEVEELGFCKKGDGGPFVEAGNTDIGGKIPINTDGGLLSCGHPFGATGLRQAIEMLKQLQGRANHQVEGARTGLQHNLSGMNVEHTIVIYGLEPVT